MAEQQIYTKVLDNGMVLLAEQMDWVESAAFCFVLPSGCKYDPEGKEGLNNLLCDMTQRGAGSRDTRQLLTDLENMGVDYGGSVGNGNMTLSGASLAERLPDALEIFADIIQEPHLPEDQLADSRQVCHQEIRSLEDEMARRVMLDLRRRHYPHPLGRDQFGTHETVDAIQIDDVRAQWKRLFVPSGTVLGVAGKFDWEQLQADVQRHFGAWSGGPVDPPELTPALRGYGHTEAATSQTHMAVAYRAVPADHDDYYRAWAAVNILGDGQTSRLWTEVREERGLAYSCGASYHVNEHGGCVQCYAGATTERAQETIDVMLAEIHRLQEGVSSHEVDRLKSMCKTALVMQQESSRARAGSLAFHWRLLGRVRPLAEVQAAIDALNCENIAEYLRSDPPADFTIATLGEQPLETSIELS